MDTLPIDLPDDQQTFHLIRLPRETVERASSGSCKVGTLYVGSDGFIEFQDNQSRKVYSLVRNDPVRNVASSQSGGQQSSQKRTVYTAANNNANLASSNESDLLNLSIQKDEAIHLGKVKTSTFLAVPKADETNVSIAS